MPKPNNLKVKQVLKTIEHGPMLLRSEVVDDSDYGGTGSLEMKTAYTRGGDYVGDWRLAKTLWDDYGIVPQLSTDSSTVCTVGYSERSSKWYGWSHRAIHGYGVGDQKFESEDTIQTIDEAREEAAKFAESVS